MCSAKSHVRFASDNDRESGFTQKVMSALPPKADVCGANRHVRYGPIADIAGLFDQLVCTTEQLTWYLEAKRLCGCEIDEELKVGRLNDW
jgi:hypothetical protein